MDAVHLALTAGRPWDLVLDVAAGKGAARRWPVLLHHVRRGGRVAVRLPGKPGPVAASVAKVRDAQATGVEAPTPGRDPRDNPERDLAALAASAADLAIDDGWLVATNAVDTLAKVPEADGDAFLRARPAAGRTLTTVPGLRFTSRCLLRTSAPVTLPSEIEAPAVSVREYDDVTCLGRQAAYGDGFVLPETYRHPFKRRLRNVAFAEWAPRFVRQPAPAAARLEGPAYLLDSYVRGHFGHALTDQVGHFWGWRVALERHPDLRALVFAKPGTSLAGLGAGPPRRRRRRRRSGRRGPRAHRGRHAGQLLATVRDAGLRASRDRHDVRRGRHPPGRAGIDGHADAAAVVLLAPARQAHLPQRGGGGGAVRRLRFHGRPPGGPPARGPGADGARGRRRRGLRRQRHVPDRVRRRAEARGPRQLGVLHGQQRVPDLLGRWDTGSTWCCAARTCRRPRADSRTGPTSRTSPTTTRARASSCGRCSPRCESGGEQPETPIGCRRT